MKFADDRRPSAAVDPLVGRRLGEYVLVQRIGEGGFGVVYRAEQPTLSRDAVVKVLHVKSRVDEGVLRRFTAEAQIASRLDHPYAAHVYGYGAEPDGLLWIAMELVRGVPLETQLLLQGPIKLDRFVTLFERVCEVVHTAHEQGIVHRDIKPANIMVLSRAGRLLPKLLDFGIAKVVSSALDADADGDTVALRPADVAIADDQTAEVSAIAGDRTARADSEEQRVKAITTQSGARTGNEILGSPFYMAPEQWTSPRDIDARTDIYALGLVAFESLTGKRAIDGSSVAAIMAAQSKLRIELPSTFPRGLAEALAKATSPNKADRYATAIELAEAVRAATGVKPETASLPQLDRSVRDRFAERAPEPLADAIVALEHAENAHAARDAIVHVARMFARWLGLLAIACRTRIGGSQGADRSTAPERLRILRREGLRDADWLELARELVQPFANRRELHPMPELVDAMCPAEGEPRPMESLHRLLNLHATTDANHSLLRTRLPDLVRQLGAVLKSLWFVTEYDLVVPRGSRAERFAGSRRIPRSAIVSPDLAPHDGKPVVLDGEGTPILVLSPLVQATAPTAGADRELFVLDGPARAGARLVAPRLGFEIHDPTLWDWFQHALLADEGVSDRETIEDRPYRGLSTFTETDAHLFYGREREIDAFVNRLRVTPWLAVVGPSGAGKSSFVRAGVLATLGWDSLVVRPGASPLAALAARLAAPGVDAAALAARPERLGEALRDNARAAGFVLVIDQLEELFTLCNDPAERDQFARAIAMAARTADDPLRVVVTLRDDFLMRAEGLSALRERLAIGLQLLGTPRREDLVRVLVEPARRAGYELEDDKLVDEMVDEVRDRPNALALLSFTAAALWELRDRHFKHLTRKAYTTLGGVGGALARHAEATLGKMPADQRALVREAFRRLVTSDGTRAVLRRDELRQVLGSTPKSDDVVEALVGSRLLSVAESEAGETIEITHEALLSAWPRLVEWRREDAEGARLRDQLRSAAQQWEERGRPDGLLWRGDALAELRLWRGRTAGSLTAVEAAFVDAAQRLAARGRFVRRSLLVGAFVVMAAGLVGALWLNARTNVERARAVESLADLYEEQGRLALQADRPGQALVYLVKALEHGASGPALRVLLAAAARPLDAARRVFDHGDSKLWWVAYSPDGKRLVTASSDRLARLWNVETGQLERTFAGHTHDVVVAKFSADGQRLLTASWDGSARVWNAADGALVSRCAIDGGDVESAAFRPDDAAVAIIGARNNAGIAQICNAKSGEPIATITMAKRGHAVAWSPDGLRLATASDSGAAIWDAQTGAKLIDLATTDQRHVLFHPDGTRVLTAAKEGIAIAWDSRDGRELVRFVGHTRDIERIELSPDGSRLTTASHDRTARIWKIGGELIASLEGHQGNVYAARFSPTGDRILTAGADGMTRLWDANTGITLALRDSHSSQIFSATFRPDGREIATASWDGTAIAWSTEPDHLVNVEPLADEISSIDSASGVFAFATTASTGPLPVRLRSGGRERVLPGRMLRVDVHPDGSEVVGAGHDHLVRRWSTFDGRELGVLEHRARVRRAIYANDGTSIVTTSDDGKASIWDTATNRQRLVLDHGATPPLAATFDPTGSRVATAKRDGTVQVWSTATGALLHSIALTNGWIEDVSISPDGRSLVTANQDVRATIWNIGAPKPAGVLVGHSDGVVSAVFSPTGELVATASDDGTIRIWDLAKFRQLLVLRGHRGGVRQALFVSDETIWSSGHDKTIRQWRVVSEQRSLPQLMDLARCRVAFVVGSTGVIVPEKVDRSRCVRW